MNEPTKDVVSKEDTFDRLEIRVGKVLSVIVAGDSPKVSYVIKADFGKFGVRSSVGRFTKHTPSELSGKLILGVLNLGSRQIGSTVSEFLCLGVQYPRADSGEASIITPLVDAKIGGKVF